MDSQRSTPTKRGNQPRPQQGNPSAQPRAAAPSATRIIPPGTIDIFCKDITNGGTYRSNIPIAVLQRESPSFYLTISSIKIDERKHKGDMAVNIQTFNIFLAWLSGDVDLVALFNLPADPTTRLNAHERRVAHLVALQHLSHLHKFDRLQNKAMDLLQDVHYLNGLVLSHTSMEQICSVNPSKELMEFFGDAMLYDMEHYKIISANSLCDVLFDSFRTRERFLDYVVYSHHWVKDAIQSDVNFNPYRRTLGNDGHDPCRYHRHTHPGYCERRLSPQQDAATPFANFLNEESQPTGSGEGEAGVQGEES